MTDDPAGPQPASELEDLRARLAEAEEALRAIRRGEVTDQKSHEQIVAAERLARLILEQAVEAIVVCDGQGRVIRASQAARRFCDGDPLLRPFAEVFPLRTGASDLFHLAPVLQGEALGNVDVSLDWQGQTFDLILNAGQLHDGQRVLGCVVTLTDITDRRRAAEALRDAETRYRLLFEQSPDGIVIVAPESARLLEFNETAHRQLGYSREEFARLTISDLEAVETPEETNARIASVSREGRDDFETRQRNKQGDIRNVHVTAQSTRLAGRSIYHCVWRDITERKRAEEEKATLEAQLQQARKMESVGRLAGGVAHDFNNMLGVILGHAELALEQVDPDQPLHADLAEIRKAALRSADLTRQLLAFARKQTVAPTVLDLNDTVSGMLTMLHRLIGENIDVAWQPAADLWPVKVDPSQIDQILANLCLNARDAIAGVGTLTIETGNRTFDERDCGAIDGCDPGDYVLLALSDNGGGMDKETLALLFEPFFTTKVLGKGTGLGLATVYGIVKQNHGFITVDSELNQGTTFKIYLPRHAGITAHARSEGDAHPLPRGRETILLVEDEPAILTMTKTMLEHQGYAVLAANTPGAAIRLAREHAGEIHLLVTDVVMPEMNGRDLAQHLLSEYPHLRRLFMSGYTADVIAPHGVLDDGVHFIQKPFTRKDLARKVREALGDQS